MITIALWVRYRCKLLEIMMAQIWKKCSRMNEYSEEVHLAWFTL